MPLKNFTLLFVEDDIDTQEQIKMLLEEDVQELYQAFDGEEGITLYQEKKPDIVLTDINLPFLNGLELTAKIKEIEKGQPIIIMSAFDDRDNLLNSINLGSDGFITKPLDVDILYERLNTIAYELDKKHKESKKTNEKIKELHTLAHYDSLTQLPNRFTFEKELTECMHKAKEENIKFALFFIDLDNFKTINDNFGHAAGDFVLQTITNNILKALSSSDTLARRSGDEFLILLRNYSDKGDLKQIAYNILDFTSQCILWEGQAIYTSCSIGISEFPADATSKKSLLTLADIAMYNAKNSGKNNYFFASENHSYEIEQQKHNNLIYINADLVWNKANSNLVYKDKELILTKNELLFLSLLFSCVNYQFTYEQIYRQIWGSEFLHKKESLKTLVKLLRKKLPINFIVNVFNIGYKIELNG